MYVLLPILLVCLKFFDIRSYYSSNFLCAGGFFYFYSSPVLVLQKETLTKKLPKLMREGRAFSSTPQTAHLKDPSHEAFLHSQFLKAFLRCNLFSPCHIFFFFLSWQMPEQRTKAYVCQHEALLLAFFLISKNYFSFS